MSQGSPRIAAIVCFVRDQLSWPLSAQASACGVDPTTLRRWSRQDASPSGLSLESYLSWLSTLAIVRSFGCSGSWSMPEDRELGLDWRVMLLLGKTRWVLVYQLRGTIESVEAGDLPSSCSRARLLEGLAHHSKLKAAELLLEHEEAEALREVHEVDFARLAI